MRNILSIVFVVNFLFCWCTSAQRVGNGVEQKNSNKNNNYFIKNEGQILDQYGIPNKKVLYLLNTSGLNVQLHKNGFSYDVYENKIKETCIENEISKLSKINFRNLKSVNDSSSMETLYHRIDIDFLEANKDLLIEEHDVSKSYTNYYNIAGFEEGITNVHSFKKIVYKDLYEGIDLEFFVPTDKSKPVEYNFIIRPDGDISSIKMKISGTNADVDNNSLKMNLIHGRMNETIPKSWIRLNKGDKEVAINYVKKGNNVFGFEATDRTAIKFKTLIIDPTPVREWSTYFGGEKDETQYNGNIETDSNGNIFISGYTRSQNNIATTGSFQNNYSNSTGSWVGYLAKFSTDGVLIWSTYYGNTSTFRGMAIDKENNIIAVGDTSYDTNIATIGAHQTDLDSNNYADGFFVKFNNNGIRLWGTYYGGESIDVLMDVTVDENLNIYAVGSTSSNNNISSPGSFSENVNLNVHFNWNSFIVKLNKDGQRQWATYYGGTYGIAIDVDNNGNVYMQGTVQRGEADYENISTPGAYQENYTDEGSLSWNDSFLVKFNTNGERQWGTFFGGDSYDDAEGLVVDHADNVIICGSTRSNIFKTTNAFQANKGGAFYDYDAYLAKFDSNGQILWNTFYGGIDGDSGKNVDVDNDNNIFLVGASGNVVGISTVDAYQEIPASNEDAYLTKFSPNGERIWGTFYGGASGDQALDIEVTSTGDLYMLGLTFGSINLATPGAYQENFNGEIDNFIVKFKDCLSSIDANASEYLCAGEDIEFTADGGISYLWSGPNGFTSTDQNPVIANASLTDSGIYTVFIESANGCDDTREFDVLVSQKPVAYTVTDIVACEDVYATGISSTFNTSNIESQVLGGQTNMVISYFDENGVELPSSLPNPMANMTLNTQLIIVRVANENNPVCYAETSFSLIVIPLPNIVEIDDVQICDDNSDGYAFFNLEDIPSNIIGNNTNVAVEFYFENGQLITNPLFAIRNQVANEEIITVRVINTDTYCYNESSFKLIVNPLPIASNLQEIIGCDDNNDGISEYFDTSNIESQVLGNQTGLQVSYFDVNGNPLPSPLPNPYTNTISNEELITVRVTNPITTCFSENLLTLRTASKPQINQPQTLYACNLGNGFANFDLADIETKIIGNQSGLKITYFDSGNNQLQNPLPSTFRNTQAWSQTIYVRVENELNGLCYSETSFNLIVNQLPMVSMEDSYFLCHLEPSLSVSVGSNFDTYNWEYQDGTIISSTYLADLMNAGNYTLTVGQNNNGIYCENSFDFKLIRSELPSIVNVEYNELSDDNYIKINASGDGDFEYSIDGINYQSSNLFNNVSGGIYTVLVRDALGCGEDFKEVIIIDYPKYFTPNGDGVNDTWQIKGIRDYPNVEIFIYDRYGKLLKQLFAQDEGWNGTFRGENLTATDYWFTVKLTDSKAFTGHFALKR